MMAYHSWYSRHQCQSVSRGKFKLSLSLISCHVYFDGVLKPRRGNFALRHSVADNAHSTGPRFSLTTAGNEKCKHGKGKVSSYHFKILHKSPAQCGDFLFPTHATIEGYWRVKVHGRINNTDSKRNPETQRQHWPLPAGSGTAARRLGVLLIDPWVFRVYSSSKNSLEVFRVPS